MTDHETAEYRALYIVAQKGYGAFDIMAEDLNVSKSYVSQLKHIGVPINYAGYLGRKFKFHPAILCYESYIRLRYKPVDYDELFSTTKFFDARDIRYILDGTYIKDPAKFLRIQDRNFNKKEIK